MFQQFSTPQSCCSWLSPFFESSVCFMTEQARGECIISSRVALVADARLFKRVRCIVCDCRLRLLLQKSLKKSRRKSCLRNVYNSGFKIGSRSLLIVMNWYMGTPSAMGTWILAKNHVLQANRNAASIIANVSTAFFSTCNLAAFLWVSSVNLWLTALNILCRMTEYIIADVNTGIAYPVTKWNLL